MALPASPLAFSTGPFPAEGRFERVLPTAGGAPIEIIVRTGAGSLTVRAGEPSSVRVSAAIRVPGGLCSIEEAEEKIRRLEAHPPIVRNGNTLVLGAITDPSLQHNIAVSYELVVPRATRLKAKSGAGDQTISGILGPLEVSTGSGCITASNIGGSVQAATGSGDICLQSVPGAVRVSTGSGGVQALEIGGGFEAVTGSGDVILDQAAEAEVRVASASGNLALRNVRGGVRAKTASGSISIEGGGRNPWRLETVSGDIIVRIPLHWGFDLRAHSVSGGVSTHRPLILLASDNHRGITGRAGNGGFLVEASTVSGGIHIDWLGSPEPLPDPASEGF